MQFVKLVDNSGISYCLPITLLSEIRITKKARCTYDDYCIVQKILIFYFQIVQLWPLNTFNFRSEVYLQLQNPAVKLITIEKFNQLNYSP